MTPRNDPCISPPPEHSGSKTGANQPTGKCHFLDFTRPAFILVAFDKKSDYWAFEPAYIRVQPFAGFSH
jgi:hypothetical protein